MKKTIAMIIMSMILLGCTGILPFQKRETIQIPKIHEGVQGLELEYLAQMPPHEIFENQLFEIGLELHNKGAEDIQNGIYNIAVNEQYITLVGEKMNRFNIKGKSIYEPLGGKKRISIRAQANEMGEQMTRQSTTIITNLCYEYATKGTILTCIDTQPLKKETKVCTVKSISTGIGQGGPIGIIKVEPQMLPHDDPDKIKPSYIIHIANLGKGQVVDTGSVYDACTGRSIGKEQYDTIIVNALLSNEMLTCEPQQLKIRQQENKILCTLEKGINKNMGNYQTPLIVELEYGYIQTKPLTIRLSKPTY
jgi:hypothetical protein